MEYLLRVYYRHLTNTDHLVQEDLRLLITAILNKQKTRENERNMFKSTFNPSHVCYFW